MGKEIVVLDKRFGDYTFVWTPYFRDIVEVKVIVATRFNSI